MKMLDQCLIDIDQWVFDVWDGTHELLNQLSKWLKNVNPFSIWS